MTAYPVVRLSEVAEVGAGNSAPQKKELFDGGKYPFIRTSDVGKIRFGQIDEAADFLNEKGIKKLRLVPKGSILMPKSGASTFLNHRVEMSVDAYVSSHLATITARPDRALSRYLLYYLSTLRAQDLIQDHKYPSLTLGQIGSIEVALPPLEEQKRIVAVLDQAFAALDRARALAEANLADAAELFSASLDLALEEMEVAHGLTPLGQHVTFKNGFAFKSAKFSSDGEPVVRISNIQDGEVVLDKVVYSRQKDYREDLSKYHVETGELLIAMSGATTGKIGFNNTGLTLLQNQRVGRFAKTSDLNLEYLAFFLGTKVAEHLAISAGAAQPNLSTKQICEVLLPIPSKDDQARFVARLGEINGKCKGVGANYAKVLDDIENLRKSLLQKAFAGELT